MSMLPLTFGKSKAQMCTSYRKTSKAETAFVGFGARQEECFSLEITKIMTDFVLGNAISYLGMSMLRNNDESCHGGSQARNRV